MASRQSLFACAATLAIGCVAHASLHAGTADDGDSRSAAASHAGPYEIDAASLSLLQRVAKNKGEEAISSSYLPAQSSPHCSAKLVVDVGLPRTSTVSFSLWVNKLGFTSIHHLPDYGWRDDHYQNFYNMLPQEPTALSDAPWALEACFIAARRPPSLPISDLKFVSIQRDAAAWYNSIKHMTCAYGGGMNEATCTHMRPGNETLEYGWELAHVPGVYGDIAFSYRANFINFTIWLRRRWCQNWVGNYESLCGENHNDDPNTQTEIAVAAAYIQNFSQRLKSCVGEQNLLEVQMEDDDKVHKIADFLGCQGDIPPYPAADAVDHALLQTDSEMGFSA